MCQALGTVTLEGGRNNEQNKRVIKYSMSYGESSVKIIKAAKGERA